MKFTLTMNLDNAAFRSDGADGEDVIAGGEVARILRKVANDLAGSYVFRYEGGNLTDTNGNRVGKWEIQ